MINTNNLSRLRYFRRRGVFWLSAIIHKKVSSSKNNQIFYHHQKSPQKVKFKKILARVFFLQYLRVYAVYKLQ